MITPYNDYTMTNRIDSGSEKGRLIKRILRKHTSHPDNIRAALKSGKSNQVRRYMNKELESNVKKIILLIDELKKEAKERQDMLDQISEISNFTKVHDTKQVDQAKEIADKIWGEVMETLYSTEKNHKKTLLILADEIYKIGGLKDKVQRKQAIISNLEQNVRPKSVKKLIQQRNLKTKLQELHKRAVDIQMLNNSIKQNEEIIDKLHNMLKPIAKKHNIKITSEDNQEKFSNNYKSIFKNENKN